MLYVIYMLMTRYLLLECCTRRTHTNFYHYSFNLLYSPCDISTWSLYEYNDGYVYGLLSFTSIQLSSIQFISIYRLKQHDGVTMFCSLRRISRLSYETKRRWRLLLSTRFDHSRLFTTLHDSCEDSLMRWISAWPSAKNYKRRPTLSVINMLDGQNLLSILDTPPLILSVLSSCL